MVMTLHDYFPLQPVILGDIYSSVVEEESSFFSDASLMSEGICDSLVPGVFLSESVPDLVMEFSDGWHDKGSKMLGLEDDQVLIVLLSLVMVVPPREEVCFLVRRSREVV